MARPPRSRPISWLISLLLVSSGHLPFWLVPRSIQPGLANGSLSCVGRYTFPDCVYDIVSVLYEYVRAVRPARGKPFFHIPSLLWSLTPAHYNQRLRVVAVKHGLDPDRVHSHSVRIGGATVLAAAQVPDYVIMAMGGWASAVYLQYDCPSLQLYAAAQEALANATFISAQSIRAMHSHQSRPSYERERFILPPADAFKLPVDIRGLRDL